MNKILSNLGLRSKIPKIKPGKSEIHLPFSRSGDDKRSHSRVQSDSQSKKTMVGIQAKRPLGEHTTKSSSDDLLICQECQYPLRVKPSKSSPCPNCGFSGSDKNVQDTVSNCGKTMAVSSIESIINPEIREFKFKLIEESSNSEIKVESEDPEVILNRSHLDPNNMSISGEKHVLIKFRVNKIFIEDVSSNGSTFIQVRNTMMVQPDIRLILGNKICIFNLLVAAAKTSDADKATRKFGGIDLNSQENASGFALTDEKSGKRTEFNEQYVIVNRANLDTSNNTISGSRHAEFRLENGCWYLRDLSSTGSTFIQVKTEYQLENKIKLVFGNKVFRFEYDL